MSLGMAVGAQENAFGDFLADVGLIAVRQIAQVEMEELSVGITVMPGQCGEIPFIPTLSASATSLANKSLFAI